MFYFISSYWYAIGVLIAIGGWGVWYGIRTQKRQNLAKGVLKMGNMVGKRYSEFESNMGTPSDIDRRIASNTNEWVKIVTWQAGGYQIIIMFDNDDVFDHIVSESRY